MNFALQQPAGSHEENRAPRDAAGSGGLDPLVLAITAVESVVAGWDAAHQLTVQALQTAIEDLHKEAFRRLIRALKDDAAAGKPLRAALADPVVYGVLRYHGLVKAPLAERVQQALDEVGPMLAGHGGAVELVALKPPDTVELRLTGACHGCPSSGQTLRDGIETAIKAHCPEVVHVNQVSRAPPEQASTESTLHFVSPFARQLNSGWVEVAAAGDVPEAGIAAVTLKGRSLLLSRRGTTVSCFDNACAHLGMPLDAGQISDGVITCTHHGFRYLLETGECLTAPEVQLKVHGARLLGDRIHVRLED